MKIHKYQSYDEYKKIQNDANRRKENWVWVSENAINRICEIYGTAKNVICHGTRNGAEQKYFSKNYPDAYVIGTEIADTATKYERTVKWDFSEEKKEWTNKFDIVYSNSFDHSFDPEKTINVWKKQLNENGMLFLEWTSEEKKTNPVDPTGGTIEDLKSFLNKNHLEIVDSFSSTHLKTASVDTNQEIIILCCEVGR